MFRLWQNLKIFNRQNKVPSTPRDQSTHHKHPGRGREKSDPIWYMIHEKQTVTPVTHTACKIVAGHLLKKTTHV